MNIQRYKLPVIIAAGLHGALFLHSTNPTVIASEPPVVQVPAKPPVPTIEIDQTIAETSSESSPSGSDSAVQELPEVPTKLTDQTVFTVPIVDHPRAEKYDNTLKEYRGVRIGDGLGPIDAGRVSGIPAAKLDRQPRATAQISPDYPSTMKQQEISGSVVIEFVVNIEGRVVQADVVSCTRREFAEPALRAVRNWRFEPGKRNGRLVQFRMTVPIEFGLNNN